MTLLEPCDSLPGVGVEEQGRRWILDSGFAILCPALASKNREDAGYWIVALRFFARRRRRKTGKTQLDFTL
ncbi:hypothetical protein ACLOJK_009992 [Asimina triloba]